MRPKGRSGVRGFGWLACAGLLFLLQAPATFAQVNKDDEALQDFFQAVVGDDPQSAKQILLANTNLARVPASRYLNKFPLLVAASKGQLEIVDLLLKLGADVNAEGDTWNTSNHRLTALEVSIWYNHPAVCRRLLETKPDLNHRSSFNGGALQMALANRHDEMAGWLLDQGADAFLPGGHPYQPTTPFAVNIQQGDGTLVPRMLKNASPTATAYLRTNGTTLLRSAATRGQVEAVAALLQAGVGLHSDSEADRPVLQALALAATKPTAPGASVERYAQIRDLLQKAGASYDAFVVTGFGDLETARQLASTNKTVASTRDGFGATPLHWAVQANQPRLTSFWLETGASPAATNFAGQTPVHLAAAAGLTEQLDLLLSANPPLDIRDTNGWTALDTATQAKQTATIRRLLADPRMVTPSDRGIANSLHEAAASGNIVVLAALVNATNIDPRNELGFTPFQVAMQKGQLGAAAFLFDQGANVNARDPEGNTALHQITGNWTFSIRGRPSANWIARRNQNPRQSEYLRYLAAGGNEDGWPRYTLQAVGLLLACGADATLTNQAGKTPVQLLIESQTSAFESERVELLKLLGVAGNNLNRRDANGDTALHRAAHESDGDPVAELLAAGADVNATNRMGRTPLHVSLEKLSSWGSSPFQLILAAKPNVNTQDREGLTPLHVLALSESSFRGEATKALLDAGANPNLRDKQGRSPIQVLLTEEWPWHGAEESVPLLAQAGADVRQPDAQGRTPLHLFAALGNDHQHPLFFVRELTNVFRADTVDFNAQDAKGDTPLHLAARNGDADMFTWLCRQGAKLDVTNRAGETPRLLVLNQTNRFARIRFPANEDIHDAATRDDAEAIRRLLRVEPRLVRATNSSGDTPLRVAAKNHQTNAVNALISSGAAWDEVSAAMLGRTDALKSILARNRKAANSVAYGKPVLHWAATSGSVPAVETLLAAGAKLDAGDRTGFSALGAAIRSNRMDVVTLLRARGATENLFDCILLDQPELVVALIQSNPALGAKTNAVGLTPVMTAVACGQTRVLAALLEPQLPHAPTTSSRFTALHVAALCNRTNEASLLLQNGMDVVALDYAGAQPLHYAAAAGAAELIVLLLQHGANPDVPVKTPGPHAPPMLTPGTTALHLAALGGHTNAIAALLRGGANVNPANAMGLTPVDLAYYSGQPGMPFSFQFNRLAIPGTIVRFSLFDLGVSGLKPAPPILSPNVRQAVIEQLEQAGATRGKPVRYPDNQPWSPGGAPGRPR